MKSHQAIDKNDQHSPSSPVRARRGFSIVEVAIAMAVVTLLLTTFLGVFAPAQKNIQRALSTKEANRLKDALSNEMSILRESELTTFTTSFNKGFSMIANSHDSSDAIILYKYRADSKANPADGVLPAFLNADGTSKEGIQGRDYIIQTAVRNLGVSSEIARIENELKAVEGGVFAVRMTQLINDTVAGNTVLKKWDQAGITNPDNPAGGLVTAANYTKAVVAFTAEFFQLRANTYSYVGGGNWDFMNIGNPVAKANMAFRR